MFSGQVSQEDPAPVDSSAEQSASDINSDDNESDDVHPSPRRERLHLLWTQEQSVRWWTQVELSIRHFSAEGCDHSPLVARGGLSTNQSVKYRYECVFENRLGCPWQLRVTVPFDQATAAVVFLYRNPQSPATDSSFDRNVYDRQSMVHGKKDERQVQHANHKCDINVSGRHGDHHGKGWPTLIVGGPLLHLKLLYALIQKGSKSRID